MLGQVDLPKEEIDWFSSRVERRTLRRGASFCRIGQTYYEAGVLESGILEVYELTDDGEKVVLDFLFPGDGVLALTNALKERPCEVSIDAVKPCVVAVWPFELRETARTRHHQWALLEAKSIEKAFIRKQDRYHAQLTLNAKQRYRAIDREFPATWREIPQHLLASYLHVTPSYLSRLTRSSAVTIGSST